MERQRGWGTLGANNRLQMPLLERATCEKVGPHLWVQSHPLEKRALLYCKGAPGTLLSLSMALGWGTGRIQGGPVFSTAEPSIEAANAMGALGALQEFRGPCFNGHQFFLTSILCVCLSLLDRLERGKFLCRSNRMSSSPNERELDKNWRKTVWNVEGVTGKCIQAGVFGFKRMLACAYVCQVLLTGDVVSSRSISGETGANHSLLKNLPISTSPKQTSSCVTVSQCVLILCDCVR